MFEKERFFSVMSPRRPPYLGPSSISVMLSSWLKSILNTHWTQSHSWADQVAMHMQLPSKPAAPWWSDSKTGNKKQEPKPNCNVLSTFMMLNLKRVAHQIYCCARKIWITHIKRESTITVKIQMWHSCRMGAAYYQLVSFKRSFKLILSACHIWLLEFYVSVHLMNVKWSTPCTGIHLQIWYTSPNTLSHNPYCITWVAINHEQTHFPTFSVAFCLWDNLPWKNTSAYRTFYYTFAKDLLATVQQGCRFVCTSLMCWLCAPSYVIYNETDYEVKGLPFSFHLRVFTSVHIRSMYRISFEYYSLCHKIEWGINIKRHQIQYLHSIVYTVVYPCHCTAVMCRCTDSCLSVWNTEQQRYYKCSENQLHRDYPKWGKAQP